MTASALGTLAGKLKREQIEQKAKDKPVWGKHKVKEREAIEEAERIRQKKIYEDQCRPYDIDKEQLPLSILERKVLRSEGAENYKDNNFII
jgi:hypothetical protein